MCAGVDSIDLGAVLVPVTSRFPSGHAERQGDFFPEIRVSLVMTCAVGWLYGCSRVDYENRVAVDRSRGLWSLSRLGGCNATGCDPGAAVVR